MKSDEETNFTSKLDLNELTRRHALKLVITSVSDEAGWETSRLLARAEADYVSLKDKILFFVVIGLLAALMLTCILIILLYPSGIERTWSLATLTAIVTGTIGYLLGNNPTRSLDLRIPKGLLEEHELRIGDFTPENLVGALLPAVKEMDPDNRLRFASKLFERNLLSSGKAARLAGMDRVTFLLNLHKVGVAAIDLDEEELEDQAHYVNSR